MPVILHIAREADWARAKEAGVYAPESLAREGFVHASFLEQVLAVANALFRGERNLVLLVIDPERLDAPLLVEGGYPHIYGPVKLDAVVAALPFPPGPDGRFGWPEGIQAFL